MGHSWMLNIKRVFLLFSVVAVTLLFTSGSVYSDETGATESSVQRQQKDECLLLAIKCGTSIVSIQDKIEKLKDEIAKGKTAYTAEELNKLKKQLEDVSKTLDYLLER